MGYLNRMGFFDHLAQAVDVSPERPFYSGAKLHRGSNSMLVEIARINKDARDDDLPTRLTDAISYACSSREDVDELKGAAWTIFAELIDNIFAHSATQLDGYAALVVRRSCWHCPKLRARKPPQPRQCRPAQLKYHSSDQVSVAQRLKPLSCSLCGMANPDFSPEVHENTGLVVEKGRILRHNCVVHT